MTKSTLDHNIAVLAAALAAAGHDRCQISYDGSGGQPCFDWAIFNDQSIEMQREDNPLHLTIGPITYLATDENTLEVTETTGTFQEALEETLQNALEAGAQPGWCEEDGGSGTLTLDSKGKAVLDHSDNMIVEDSQSFSLDAAIPAKDFYTPILAHNNKVFGEALAAAGISEVTITYNGSGDDGEITEIDCGGDGDLDDANQVTYQRLRGVLIDGKWERRVVDMTAPLEDALKDYLYVALEATGNSGYMNNEGGGGTLTITDSGKANLVHYDNEQHQESEESVFGMAP